MPLLRSSLQASLLAALLGCASSPLLAQSHPDALASCTGEAGNDTYAGLPIASLKKLVPALKDLQAVVAPDPANCFNVLNQTGPLLATMIGKMPNLIAQENVWQMHVPLPYSESASTMGYLAGSSNMSSGESYTGISLENKLREIAHTKGNHTQYGFRIHPAEIAGVRVDGMLSEMRTDASNKEIGRSDGPDWTGFGARWIALLPDHWHEAHFRYLGTQKIHRQITDVVAFTQIPDEVAMPGSILTAAGDAISFYIQGVIWTDQTTFQPVRLQTDLLKTGKDEVASYKKLRCLIDFEQVNIPERDLIVTLPANVEVQWEMTNTAGIEAHTYSNYHLFGATSKIISQ